MGLRNAKPVQISPMGVSDTLDGSHVFPGAMAALGNLIPDLATPNTWVPRPASMARAGFAGFTAPVGNISIHRVVGTLCYGMIATGRNPGHDEPFCYDINNDVMIAITGITNANTPLSPQFVGPWEPPTCDVIGTKVVFTHPGFTLGGGVLFGWIDISNPAAPTWSGGNTTTNALPSRPSWVANFNGRAYYGVNPATGQPGSYFSDVLAATVMTNSTQVVTYDDNQRLNAAAGLPLQNQLGGILQSLMVFKSNNIYQITGDAALNNLAKNSLNVATGTQGQRSICTTPKGLAFNAPDGIRIIDFNARVGDPIGLYGMGVNRPFVFALQPTRVVLACNANVLRVSTQNTLKTGNPLEEYWYDMSRQMWSGPHTFPAISMSPYLGTFLMATTSAPGKLFTSDITLSATSTFVENGTQLSIDFVTSIFPDAQTMSEFEVLETTLNMQLDSNGSTYALLALSSGGALLGSVLVTPPTTGANWGQFNWGQANWASSETGLSPQAINWNAPVIARKMQLELKGNSFLTFKVSDIFMRVRELGFLQQNNTGG